MCFVFIIIVVVFDVCVSSISFSLLCWFKMISFDFLHSFLYDFVLLILLSLFLLIFFFVNHLVYIQRLKLSRTEARDLIPEFVASVRLEILSAEVITFRQGKRRNWHHPLCTCLFFLFLVLLFFLFIYLLIFERRSSQPEFLTRQRCPLSCGGSS